MADLSGLKRAAIYREGRSGGCALATHPLALVLASSIRIAIHPMPRLVDYHSIILWTTILTLWTTTIRLVDYHRTGCFGVSFGLELGPLTRPQRIVPQPASSAPSIY